MRKIINTFSITVLLVFTFNIGNAQNYSDTLDIELSKILTNSQLPGFGVSIVNKERILYQKGFGFANKEKKIPYTVNTIQPIASISKTLIAISVMKAIEDGHFTLETNVNDILPFRVGNPYYPNDTIKIKHLVTHTSGIIDVLSNYLNAYYYNEKPIYQKNNYTKDERRFINKTSKNKGMPLGNFIKECLNKDGKLYTKKHFSKNKAGNVYKYSNMGADLMAYIIEVATGKSYADFTKKNIIIPLNMNNSDWVINKEDTNRRAVLYSEKGFPLPVYSSSSYPSGSLKTTITDLSRYLIEIIKGNNGQGLLINPQSYKTMLNSHYVFNSENKGNLESVGVFWEKKTNGSIGHPGGNFGVTAFMYYYPESEIGMIFLTNTEIELNKELIKQFISIWRVMEKYNNKSH